MVFGCLMLIFPSSFLILLKNQWLLFQKFPCIRWLLCPVISLALPCPTILNLLSDAQNHVKYGYMFPKYFFPPSSLYHSSEVAQLCPTLCNPMDYSLPGSSIHGIFQARVLEWVVISFPRGSSQPSYQTQVSCFIIHMISNLMIFHTIFSICQTYLCICPSRTSIQLISTIWTFSIIQDLLLFRWLSVKESTWKCRRHRKCSFVLWVGKIPWRLNWQSTPIFLPGKPDGERSLLG